MGTRLFITGSLSSTFGNWEYQLGNAAILIGLLESIHKFLPDAVVMTKYELSQEFCQAYGVTSFPVEPRGGAKVYRMLATFSNLLLGTLWGLLRRVLQVDASFLCCTRLLRVYYSSGLIIDLSGDTYGDNIPFKNFLKHSADLLVAKALGKPIVSLAGSPGPFSGSMKKAIARLVLNSMTLITTREPISSDLLRELGVKTPIILTACPAFLLRPAPDSRVKEIMRAENIDENSRPIVGVTLAGYNLYSKPTWGIPETLKDLELYVPMVKFLVDELRAQVILIPHVYRANPWTQQAIQGPDYVVLKTLGQMVSRCTSAKTLKLIEGTYSSHEIKGLIGKLDMFISGRLHAGVAAWSQCVPTVLLAYGHKHVGFSRLVGQEQCVWRPSDGAEGLLSMVKRSWENRELIRSQLRDRMQWVRELSELNARIIRDLVAGLDGKSRVSVSDELLNQWKSEGLTKG